MDSGRRSGNFRGVKIALILFQSLAMIGTIALTILSIIGIGLVNNHPEKLPEVVHQLVGSHRRSLCRSCIFV
jgi:hypothetical protein